jgi:predicted transposase YdaD
MGFVNTIIRHITDGNKNEERMVKIMGGTVIETESERLIKEGRIKGRMEGRKEGRMEGENALIELYATLKRLGREADADKAMTDPEARMRLYKELMIGGEARQ